MRVVAGVGTVVGPSGAVVQSCPLLQSEVAVATHAHPQRLIQAMPCGMSTSLEKEVLVCLHPSPHAPPSNALWPGLPGGPRLCHCCFLVCTICLTLAPWVLGFPAASPSCPPGLTSGVQASAVSPSSPVEEHLRIWSPRQQPCPICAGLPPLLPSVILAVFSSETQLPILSWLVSLPTGRDFPGCRAFLFPGSSPGPHRAIPLLSFIFLWSYPRLACLGVSDQ